MKLMMLCLRVWASLNFTKELQFAGCSPDLGWSAPLGVKNIQARFHADLLKHLNLHELELHLENAHYQQFSQSRKHSQ